VLKILKKRIALYVVPLLMTTTVFVADVYAVDKPTTSASKITPKSNSKTQSATPSKTQSATPSKTQSATPSKTQSATPSKTQSATPSKPDKKHHRKNPIPNFKKVKKLKSLTPAQKLKVDQIFREYREVADPLAEKLRAAREADFGVDERSPDTVKRAVQLKEMQVQMHQIKRDTWAKLLRVLTVSQRKEIEGEHKKPRHRMTSDAPVSPSVAKESVKK